MNDVFRAGVEPGGLYTSQEIKILICYMLLGVGEPMERQMVTELIAGNGMANFFETAAAVDELARQGHLTEEEGRISLTETGRQVGDTLAGMIPYTLRERSVKAALQLLTRIRREQENTVELEKLDLSAVAELKVTDKGGVEIKLVDRIRALESLFHMLESSGEGNASELYQVLAEAAGEEGSWEHD